MNVDRIPLVGILLSTYNGEKWIRKLIESLLYQENVKVCLFVRDDGSYDDTMEIIDEYSEKFYKLVSYKGDNVGAIKSFYTIAQKAFDSSIECDYYAFCDQDDIWMKDKLIAAIRLIETNNQDKPNLYFSNLQMVDKDGKKDLGKLIDNKAISTNKYNALAAIGTYGCTCVFNKSALQHFCRIHQDNCYLYHDIWLFAVCAFCGNITYDEKAYIWYRQTGRNVSGTKKRGVSLWLDRVKRVPTLFDSERLYENIAKELLVLFSNEISEIDKKYIIAVRDYRCSFRKTMSLLLSKRMRTRSVSKNIVIKCKIIFGAL